MTLPKRPPLSNPIPNTDIPNLPQQYSIKAPYWDAIISGDLVVTEDEKLAVSGSTSPPVGEVEVHGDYWSIPLGNGLGLWKGEFRRIDPQSPPYGCQTNVITTGIADFTDAWRDCTFSTFPADIDTSAGVVFDHCWFGCENLTSFPTLDLSSGEDFSYSWGESGLMSFPLVDLSSAQSLEGAWQGCSNLVSFPQINSSSCINFSYTWAACNALSSFPAIDVSNGTDFSHAWEFCILLGSFPALNVGSGENFYAAWAACSSLTSFPALDFSNGTDFTYAWLYCTDLEDFPANLFDSCTSTMFYNAWNNCSLSQQSVDNILVSLDVAGQSNGIVNVDGGSSASPGAAGLAAKSSLEGKGWTVLTN